MPPIIQTVFSARMLLILFMGFSSGLPLLLIGSTLKAWMTEANVDLSVIGLFSLAGTPYTLKFLWSPFLDRYVPPFLGRRRGWLVMTQLGLVFALVGMSTLDPGVAPLFVAAVAVLISFMSASQDIVIDAYRRELLEESELGLGSSLAVNGYRLGMWVAGAGALLLSSAYSWQVAYLVMALIMGLGIGVTLIAPEPGRDIIPPKSLKEAVIEPFIDYFKRPGALFILAFVLLYKMGDQLASEMSMPFYLQHGYEKATIAVVVKTFGIWALISGGLLGGVLLLKLGISRSLWAFGILQMVSTLGFAVLSTFAPETSLLTAVIFFENLTGGMGTSAYVAYMASLCNRRFTATQYALLSSLIGIPRSIASAPSGWLALTLGWGPYFIFCTAIAIPGLLLLTWIARWAKQDQGL